MSVVCRSNYTAVNENGFQVKSQSLGSYHWKPNAVFKSCIEASQSGVQFDFIVVCTKALPDIRDDSVDLIELVQSNSRCAIVLVQNGFGVEWPYRQRFPHTPILSCVTVVSCEQRVPGVVIHHRWTRISIGPFFHGSNAAVAKQPSDQLQTESLAKLNGLYDAFQAGGITDAEKMDAIELQLVRWHKLAINATFNPSAVLSGGVGNAEMLKDPQMEQHTRGCMAEILTAGPLVLGAAFPSHLATIDQLINSTRRNSMNAKPSMLLDWEAGRPLELEVILHNPLKLARKYGVEMPRLQTVYALLRSAASHRTIKSHL